MREKSIRTSSRHHCWLGTVITQLDINEFKTNKKKWKTHVASGPEPAHFISKVPGVVQVIETESRMMIARGWGGRNGEFNG